MPLGRYLGFPFLFIAAVLQTSLLSQLPVRQGHLDLVLILVVVWTLLAGAEEGMLWAIVGGVMQDVAANVTMGSSALALVVVAFGVGSVVGQTGRRNVLIPPLAAALGTAIYHVLLFLIYTLLGQTISIIDSLLNVTLPTILLNAIFILPVYRIIGAFYVRAAPRRIGIE